MRFLCALVMFSVLGAQVQALSCLRPNTAKTFNFYQEAPDSYRLFVGTVKMTGAIPKYVEGKSRTAKAIASGRFVGRSGLTKSHILNVTVQTQCVASWCGGFPGAMDKDVIMYIKQSPKGDVIDIDACPGGFGQVATNARVDLLQKCLRKGKCSNADIKEFEFK